MKLVVNGEERAVENARSVAELIDALGLPARAVLVEHNGSALFRTEWETRTLTEGDRLEIIRVVAGG